MPRHSGFILFEIVIVISIFATLAVVALPHFINFETESTVAKLNSMKGALQSATKLVHSKAKIEGFS